jgi:flagellar biosynthesis/type III secretory pathway M-ring protein FliF/YscJ
MINLVYGWIAAGGLIVAALTLLLMFWQKTILDRDRRDEQQQETGKTSEILREVNEKLKCLDDKATKSNVRLESFLERLVVVEESTKSAHHRIDEIQKSKEEKP